MIVVPEIETVVILVPRTGSGSLKRAIAERYPESFALYRHMEADGVPHGYDRWRRVGVLRHPLARLWSLYHFCRTTEGGSYAKYPEIWSRIRRSVDCSFDQWLRNNELTFTQPYDSAGLGRFWPQFSILHSLPETRKSQFLYLRPDLGTEIFLFDHLDELERALDVRLGHFNRSTVRPIIPYAESGEDSEEFWDVITRGASTCPAMTDLEPSARGHIESFHAWDLAEWDRRYHGRIAV
jgi:hypothetical protein